MSKNNSKKTKPSPTVGVLVFRDNFSKVLLVENTTKTHHKIAIWGLPVGRVEKRESLINATQRELLEETGLDAKIEDIIELPIYYEEMIERKNGPKLYSMQVFICNKYTSSLKANEETTPKWIEVLDMSKLNLIVNVKHTVEKAITILMEEKS